MMMSIVFVEKNRMRLGIEGHQRIDFSELLAERIVHFFGERKLTQWFGLDEKSSATKPSAFLLPKREFHCEKRLTSQCY